MSILLELKIMEYFFTFLLAVLYKLVALIPAVLILIAIIKLYRKEKSSGVRLMLIGNVALIIKIIVIDSLADYFLRYNHSLSISNVGAIYTGIGLIAMAFSILFAIGLLMFALAYVKNSPGDQ
ncbi:MAG: hypothetical protein ABIP51_21850 [Bacteroidia bacterium]